MVDIGKILSKTERNLWNAIVSEAMAYMKYTSYTVKALEEGHPEIAQIFQEVAGAENIHGINHLNVSGDVKTTLENLKNVLGSESLEIVTLYPRYVQDALAEGRMDAAETFMLAMDRERHHIEVFTRAKDTLEAKLAQRGAPTQGQLSAVVEAPPTQKPEPKEQVAAGPPEMAATQESPLSPELETARRYVRAREEVEGERWRVTALGRIREVVFGAQDGLLSILTLMTSVAVADVGNTTVLIAGLAGLLTGMISMSTGAYLGSKASQDLQKAEIANEAKELQEHPAEELAELVVLYQREGLSFEEARKLSEHVASDKDLWLRTLVEKELGFSAEMTTNPLKDAFSMGAAFLAGGIVPILPYFFTDGALAISVSIPIALLGLFLVGMGKGRVVHKNPFFQGLEVLVIGAGAAAVGYGLGEAIPRLF